VRRDTLLRGGQNQKAGGATDPLLRGARRSTACRRWAAKRPQNLTTSVSSDTPGTPVCCRCAPDREQAALLRPPARSKSARHRKSASAEGVGALRGYESSDGLRSGPRPHDLGFVRHTACTGFAAGTRQIASKLRPTASGQNQKRAAPHIRLSLRPASKRATLEVRFCRRRRSNRRLRRSRWLRGRVRPKRPQLQTTRSTRYTACTGFAAGTSQIASKLRSYGLRPESKAGSATYPPQPPASIKTRDIGSPLLPKA